MLGNLGVGDLGDAITLNELRIGRLGGDVLVRARPGRNHAV